MVGVAPATERGSDEAATPQLHGTPEPVDNSPDTKVRTEHTRRRERFPLSDGSFPSEQEPHSEQRDSGARGEPQALLAASSQEPGLLGLDVPGWAPPGLS